MKEINSLHDLIELGIKLHRNKLPKGFIVTLQCTPKQRKTIYTDILSLTSEYPNYIYLRESNAGFYSINILGIKFHLF